MTIEQANQYFAALPDGFASTEQLRTAFTAPVQKVQFVGVAGTAGKTVTARLLAAILHAQGIHAGLYHAGCRPLSERICIDDAPVDEGLLALTADALSAAEALPQDAAELARLNKEKAKAEKELAMFGNQLANPKFVERAPAALVEDIRAKYAKSQDKLANIEQSIQALG